MNQHKEDKEKQRDTLIQKVIDLGVYKVNDRHLFELTLSEIERIYLSLKQSQNT
ncbi:Fur-regulated basic protein FbpA [Halalkalibacterium ligniniphilum]|uniref:Fur-regulated basic protein FbpA n=1 Tax=Halalkalibacterium ligniniphilum TaxID=1134413 RepID=UPI000346195D|nr:Fur-regulated basic protein FbpA [Halalkalibacterium ligniniphilum]